MKHWQDIEKEKRLLKVLNNKWKSRNRTIKFDINLTECLLKILTRQLKAGDIDRTNYDLRYQLHKKTLVEYMSVKEAEEYLADIIGYLRKKLEVHAEFIG